MSTQARANARARDYIDHAMAINRKHGMSHDLSPEVYEGAVAAAQDAFKNLAPSSETEAPLNSTS